MMDATPEVLDRLARLQNHDDAQEAARDGHRKRAEKLRTQIAKERELRDRIASDEAKMGPMKQTRRKSDGTEETVVVDRLGPIDAKIKRLRRELAKVEAGEIPHAPGVPVDFIATAQLVPVEVPEVKSASEAERKRAIAATDAELAEVERIQKAPRPLDDVLERINAEIDRLAKRGQPRIGSLFRGGRINDRTNRFNVEVHYAAVAYPEKRVRNEFGQPGGIVDDAVALICWACEEEIREKLHALAAAQARDEQSMSADEKRAALADAYANAVDALRLEVETCFAVEEATGRTVEWRRNIHPAILLGVAVNPADALAWQE
jgi:hypothetical protein